MSARPMISALLAAGALALAAVLPTAADAARFNVTSKKGAGSQVNARGTINFTSARRATVAGTLTDICPADGFGATVIVDALTTREKGDAAGRVNFGGGCKNGGVPFTIKAKTTKGPLRMIGIVVCEVRIEGQTYDSRDCTTRIIRR